MTLWLIDLFCGAGGFTTGASLAGAIPLLAIDHSDDVLQVHKKNHKSCHHLSMKLGGPVDDFLELILSYVPESVTDSTGVDYLHIHASPPCQQISSSNFRRDTNEGIGLVSWCLDLFQAADIKLSRLRWSLEQVNHPDVCSLMRQKQLNFKHMDFSAHGVPQTRRRIICTQKAQVLENIEQSYVDWRKVICIPDNAYYVTSGSICPKRLQQGTKHCKWKRVVSTSKYCYTVTRTPTFYWLSIDLQIIGRLGLDDFRELQTFPHGYFDEIPLSDTKKRHMIANAVPPAFAKALISAILVEIAEKLHVSSQTIACTTAFPS